jgi:hypothetical protein
MVADHLSRLQVEDTPALPINDKLRDDTLLKVTDSNPWYADIINYIVSDYVPPGRNKKKLEEQTPRSNMGMLHIIQDTYLYVPISSCICENMPSAS